MAVRIYPGDSVCRHQLSRFNVNKAGRGNWKETYVDADAVRSPFSRSATAHLE